MKLLLEAFPSFCTWIPLERPEGDNNWQDIRMDFDAEEESDCKSISLSELSKELGDDEFAFSIGINRSEYSNYNLPSILYRKLPYDSFCGDNNQYVFIILAMKKTSRIGFIPINDVTRYDPETGLVDKHRYYHVYNFENGRLMSIDYECV